ncbi:MAG: GldG family protein [Candidatus Aminicenantes bacterium]|nr:MAG: GldG family protein [Candidatus Aminicenantes bacterium]
MEKIKQHLNYIALGLIFLALVSLRIWPYKKTFGLLLGLAGVACLAVYVALNLSILKQSFKRKSFLYSSNLLLVVVLVLGILVLINYFLARHHHRFDFTEAKLHSLSEQSVKVLKNLKNEVNAKCFFREGNFNKASMENLLNIYNYHSKKMKYEFIDPDKNPGMVKRYDISQDGTTILESGDKESRITSSSEEDITNAIIQVTRETKKVIYFLEGHGEASIEDSEERGYSLAKDELGKLGYEVKKLSLALSDTFPGDCSLLVIPGAEKDLLPNELDTIRNFINNEGRVFFMVDPETSPGLKPFLLEFGVQLEDDLIVDTVSRLLGGDYFMPVVSEYESHDITQEFRYATFYPFARSVNTVEEKPEGISADILAKTSPNSWSERQLTEKEVVFDKDKDQAGPIPLAVAVTVETKEEEKKEETKEAGEEEKEAEAEEEKEQSPIKQKGRLAVFGDSDFASNRYYNLSGNGNFFLNAVNWLTEEADLISIQPKTSSPRTIQLTPSQGRMIFFVSVIILPLAVLITGISIWARRRSL